jgi:hypothetical protein
MPSFLYPMFLVGAAAAAVPVLLHLLRNQQAPEVRFSAVRLLVGVRVERAQRRRIRDVLLLALRAAALVLLAVAFARPYVARESAGGGHATIVALDRSASMSIGDAWTRAKAEAARAIDSRRGEAVGLLLFDDRPELLVEPTRDHATLHAALERLAPGVGATQYAGALSRAAAALEESGASEGAVVLVGDLQGSTADVRGALPRGFTIDVREVGRPFENVALLAARRSGEAITATVRNDSAASARVRLVVADGERRVGGGTMDLQPGQAAEVTMSVEGAAGLRVAADVADAMPLDNVRYVAAGQAERPRVVIVSAAGDAFYLAAALNAGDLPEFDVVTEAASRLGALLARGGPDVIVMISPRGLDRGARDAVARFVQAGGGLLVVGGAEAADGAMSSLLAGVALEAPRQDRSTFLASFESHHPLFQGMSGAYTGLAHARFTRSWGVRAADWKMIARFDDGASALLERTVGDGRIVLFASDLNRAWNDLPLQPAFVPFVQELVRYLAPRSERDQLTPATAPAALAARLGFAELGSGRRVAINLDPRESDPARMTPATFSTAIRRTAPSAPAAHRRKIEAAESSQALWRYGLMLMLLALVLEGSLAARPRTA